MTDKTVRGRFVWHELLTPDSVAAHAFYSKALGWKTQASEQEAAATTFVASSGPIAGTTDLPAGSPHWLPYLGTEDLEESIEEAQKLGAKIVKEIETLPSGGRYAVLTDPQGAAFGLYSSDEKPSKEKPAKRGEYSWHELITTDSKGAFDFYSALLGWQNVGEHDMGPDGVYYMFGRNAALPLGGMFTKPSGQPGGSYWLGYVRVKDVNQIAKKVKSGGGTVINGPMEVPGGDYIVQLQDPQGAMFAAHTLKADIASDKDEAPAAAANEEVADSDDAESVDVADDADSDEADEPVVKKAKPAKAKKPAKEKAEKVAKEPAKAAEKKSAPVKAAKSAAKPAAKAAAKKPAAKKAADTKPAGKKAAAKGKAPAAKKGPAKKSPAKKAVKAVKAKAAGKKKAVKQAKPAGKKKAARKKK